MFDVVEWFIKLQYGHPMKYHASIEIIFIMTMQHHGNAYDIRGKIEREVMHELWLQVIFKCLHEGNVNM